MTFPSVNTLLLIDRNVFLNVSKALAQPADLVMGDRRAQMEICDPAQLTSYLPYGLERLSLDNVHAVLSCTPETTDDELNYVAWVNGLDDWGLSGSQTLQMLFPHRDVPCMLRIERPFTVSLEAPGMFFKALMATHRGVGTLHMRFHNLSTGEHVTHKAAFQLGFIGGQVREGYQQLVVPLPKWTGRIEISLAVEYSDYVDDGRGENPFLFLSDLHVSASQDQAQEQLIPHTAVGGLRSAQQGYWYAARLPGLADAGGVVDVVCQEDRKSIDLPLLPDVHVTQTLGYLLDITASRAAMLSLFVDGQFDKLIRVQEGTLQTRLSDRHLDGSAHHIALRDASGTVSCWEGVCLVPASLTPTDVLLRESAAPYPSALLAQTPARYASLKTQLAQAHSPEDLAQLSHALAIVEGGYDKVEAHPLRFPEQDAPEVSIIIPAHNKFNVTYLGLCSLLLAYNDTRFEVIVVDDASSDRTAILEELVSGITVLRNETPQRFIRSCNAAAAQARGRYIVLLNNDVEVTSGWLDALVAAFERFPNVGAVGAKLLYPNGKLQDAGGIVWSNGNPWNYGNLANPQEPRFCYARQVDYLSGAALMTSKTAWEAVGGLSSYLEPMYFEDTDYAFKLREAGYTTWFVPASVVYHYEGMTSGSDVTKGFKRFQEVNRPKFKRRWVEAYKSFGKEATAPDLEKDRNIVGRVLFADYATPRPDQDAGSYAALQEIRLVQSLGYKVSFLATNMAYLGSYTQALQNLGVEVIYAPFYLTPQDYLARHAAEFDAFYLTRYYVAKELTYLIRQNAPQAKVLFNNADLHFLRGLRAARSEGSAARLKEARKTRKAELAVIQEMDVVLSYNEAEHAVIEAYTDGAAKVVRAPWVVETPEDIPPLEGRVGLSFLGSFRHHPNVEAVHWFVREVMGALVQNDPQIRLALYGSGMPDEIKALSGPNVDAIGYIKTAEDAYDGHRIFIAPLLSGSGIKGKVMSALARGIPTVLTPVAAEGIGLRHGDDCFIASTAEEWRDAIHKLSSDDALWTQMSHRSRRFMAEQYSFAHGRVLMRKAFEAADIFVGRDDPQ